MRQSGMRRLVSVFLLVMSCGCAGSPPGTPVKNEPLRGTGEITLYDRLGGGPEIYAISDQLVDRLLQDPRVDFERIGHQHTWVATPDNVARLKMYWAQYIGMLADGPAVYEGRNLLDVHRGMDISESEWFALMDDLKQTLDHFKVPEPVAQELMTRVASTHDVVANQ